MLLRFVSTSNTAGGHGVDSAASEVLEELAVAREDSFLGGEIRLEGPDVSLMRSAEQDAVRAREHVGVAGKRGVLDLRLGKEESQLPFQRDELFVAEECLRAEPRAVDDHPLGKSAEGLL